MRSLRVVSMGSFSSLILFFSLFSLFSSFNLVVQVNSHIAHAAMPPKNDDETAVQIPAEKFLPDLSYFLAAAADHHFDIREQKLIASQRSVEQQQALLTLLPRLSANAAYKRNEFEIKFALPPAEIGAATEEIVISPFDQTDLTITLDAPLIDVRAWTQYFAAADITQSALARSDATALEASKAVARSYYQLVAAHATEQASRVALQASSENLGRAERRAAAQLGSDVDVARAQSEVLRNEQTVIDAQYSVVIAQRALQTLSGVSAVGIPASVDKIGTQIQIDLTPEAPYENWIDGIEQLPNIRSAKYDAAVIEKNQWAAWLSYVPKVSATAQERITNAAGFGEPAQWAIGVNLSWNLDAASAYGALAQDEAKQAAAVRLAKAKQVADDAIHEAWQQTEANRKKVLAAQKNSEATARILQKVTAKHEAGNGTMLDVVLAERDATTAKINQIQAEQSLALAKAILRLTAGQSLTTTQP